MPATKGPTTQYPDDYTPDRKKAIGPSRWKLSNP